MFSVCTAVIDAYPVCATIPESVIERTAAPELLLLIAFLVCATIINIVGTWRREGGFHGDGVMELEAVTRQSLLGLCHHHRRCGEAVLCIGMQNCTLLQRGRERDVSIAVEQWNQRRRCSGRGGHHW
jgi:hypothetical protein